MTEADIVEAILVWSALPGASRHHWGTEIDVYDRRGHDPGEPVELVREATRREVRMGRSDAWMDEHLQRFGFGRPYDVGPRRRGARTVAHQLPAGVRSGRELR